MDDTNKKEDRSTWAIGGGVLIGAGVGLFFVREHPIAFVASLLVGLGLGLIVTALVSRRKG
jgi:hypothetical protein